jgi:excisionase family DNA binding protein
VDNSTTDFPGFMPTLGRSVSIDQAAALLDVSRRTIYNRIRDGRLRTVRTLGGSQRVLVDSLNELGFRRFPPPMPLPAGPRPRY